jgi:drug/metabolite transporter (DMT)-like permease
MGNVFAAMFVILSAYREVSLCNALHDARPALVIVCAFIPVTLGTLLWSSLKKERWPENRIERFDVAYLNGTTGAGWLATVYSLHLLGNPIVFTCIAFGLIYPFTLLLNKLMGRSTPTPMQRVAAGIIAAGALAASAQFLLDAPDGADTATVLGLLLAVFASLFGAANNVLSAKLSQNKMAPMRIASLRFVLGIVVSVLICLTDISSANIPIGLAGNIALIGFFGIGLPLLCNQFALASIGSGRSGLYASAIPLAVSGFQVFAVMLGLAACSIPMWNVSILAALLVSGGVFLGVYVTNFAKPRSVATAT